MKVLVTGSSGLVGQELVAYLKYLGHQVCRMVRNKQSADDAVYWNPETGELDTKQLEGFDAVYHLAGENIANKRWTREQKAKIRDTRVKSTKLLSETLASLTQKPKVLISASAIGFYGDRPLENLFEHSVAVKNDYLSDTCVAWEDASRAARDAGIRVVNPRFGIILSTRGGAMSKLLLPFMLGLGGTIGDGNQFMSWITLDDVIYALNYVLLNEDISGPANFTSPRPVTNYDFTKILGKVLKRPTVLPLPSFAAKLAFGEMADALLLSSAKVRPKVLTDAGFKFSYPNLEGALAHLICS